jgi:hypothetical protein
MRTRSDPFGPLPRPPRQRDLFRSVRTPNPAAPFARALDAVLTGLHITHAAFGDVVGVHARTVGSWRNGISQPRSDTFMRIVIKIKDIVSEELLRNLTSAYDADQFEEWFEAPETIDERAIEQIPAAFRFGIQDNKIDALPETPDVLDRSLAGDLYQEFTRKLQGLAERLRRSNADPYVEAAVNRLLASLGNSFEDVRPGVVLMHSRSIEAVVAGFDSEEGRQALFPDAIAMINDITLSGQDFLACFPNVRRIERERIAAGIEKDPDVIQQVRQQTAAIKIVAAESEIVASGAVKALRENEPDIQQARNVEVAADLLADEVLITRNFVSETLRAAWEVIGPDFKDGAKAAARILPPLAVIALLTLIAGPVAGLAGILRGNIFRPVRGAISGLESAVKRERMPREKIPEGMVSEDQTQIAERISKKYGVSFGVVLDSLVTNQIPKVTEVKKGADISKFYHELGQYMHLFHTRRSNRASSPPEHRGKGEP